MLNKNSFAVVFWLQLSAAQNMLDFDYLCDREPSVLAFINPWKRVSNHKLFYWDSEILVQSFPSVRELPNWIKEKTDTAVNFASYRSAFNATFDCIREDIFENIVIIAEWIPERQIRELIEINKKRKLNIIWPSTVWAMVSGEFRVWNTWGSLDNIIDSKLYQKWSVWFVSKSWWMSNEMRRVIWDRTNWTHTSVAIGWDKFYISTFKDVIKTFEDNDEIKMIVLLWEVWGTEENEIAEMIKKWEIKKPVCAWCIWTISDSLKWEVQFGHAWAKADSKEESSIYKNKKLKEAWAKVPESFMDFWDVIKKEFDKLNIKSEEIISHEDIIEKYKKIKSRRKTSFTSTISDERWEELTYNKKLISEYVNEWSFANVISNLWLKRDLPQYAREFINMILIILADHGPAVSGATNAIVTARWWNDLKSSLIAWLTTIWPRFWGAIDWAWKYFSESLISGIEPSDFINQMKLAGINIPWIGHKVKSKFNPDKRCEIMLNYINENFPNRDHINFALKVEGLTLEKKPNLILNVDWIIACALLDIFKDIWMSDEEIKEYIDAWIFNWFFILARTAGFIGHILDQKKLKEWLHRTSWDDIFYC